MKFVPGHLILYKMALRGANAVAGSFVVELPTSNVNSVFTTVIAICKRKSIQVLGQEGPTGLAILASILDSG